MSRMSILSIGPADLVGAAFSTPLVSLAIALVVAGVIVALSGKRREGSTVTRPADAAIRSRYAPERRTLGVVAIAVVVIFVAENVVRGYLVDVSDVVTWWRFALPVFCAAVGLAVLLVLVTTRGTKPPEIPVVDARRTWATFGPRTMIIAAVVACAALLATTIAAGLASSPDDRGRYIWLAIPVPNEPAIDPVRQWFYGWAFGVPVLICLAVLVAVAWMVLHVNASRPFQRPETVVDERGARREVAAGAVNIALAGMLIALAGAWRLIARSGTGSQLIIDGQNGGEPYDMTWRYAEIAVLGGWLAPVLEITAFAVLIVVAARAFRRRAIAGSEISGDPATSEASVR